MYCKVYIVYPLLAFLVISCGQKTAPTSSNSDSEHAELSIKLEGGVALKFPIELSGSTKGAESFSSSAETGRNLATSIGYSYAGEIELEDTYSPNDMIKGHLIAFRISQFDSESNKVVFSVIQYGIFSGESISVFDDKGIRIAINPNSSEQVASSNQ